MDSELKRRNVNVADNYGEDNIGSNRSQLGFIIERVANLMC